MPDDLSDFVAMRARERVREAAQAEADYAAERARGKALGETWARLLSRPATSEPAPEAAGPTAEQIAAMTNEEWQSARTALGLHQTHDLEGSHWSDRAAQTTAAQHAALQTQPDAAMEQYIKDRAALGIKSSTSTVFGIDTPNARVNPSPWRGPGQ